jgi:hypothetical protein
MAESRKQIDEFDNATEGWKQYKRRFENWFHLSERAADKKARSLLDCIGKDRYGEVSDLCLPQDPEEKNYQELCLIMKSHYVRATTQIGERTTFGRRDQQEGESINSYIIALKKLAVTCDFGENLEGQLRDRFVAGIRSDRLKERLMLRDPLTWVLATRDAKSWEAAQKDAKELSTMPAATASAEVNEFRGRPAGRMAPPPRYTTPQTAAQQHYRAPQGRGGFGRGFGQARQSAPVMVTDCYFCAATHPKRRCPAYGKQCNKCGRMNHFGIACRNGAPGARSNVRYVEADEQYEYNVDYVEADTQDPQNNEYDDFVWCNFSGKSALEWTVTVNTLHNDKVLFKIDTGAEINVIGMAAYKAMSTKAELSVSKTNIYGFGKQPIKPMGEIDLKCMYKDKHYVIKCQIVDANVPNVLSLKDSLAMNLIRRVDAVTADNAGNIKLPESVLKCKNVGAVDLIKEFIDVFQTDEDSEFKKVANVKVTLKVDPNAHPVAHPVRPVSAPLRPKVKAKLEELERSGIIEKVPLGCPTPWCSALHVVKKKDNTIRITIDPKDLNKALMREYHPTNTGEEVALRVDGAKLFTVLDAKQGFFQLELDEESKNYTAFNTPFGRFRYRRLPMGISAAPEIFSRVYGDIFAPVRGLHIIADDFLLPALDDNSHNKVLRHTLETAREHNVTFSVDKLQLCTREVKYSGSKFTDKGVKVDEDKVKAIIDMPDPQKIENVQTLLGMVQYVGKHLRNLSSVTEPLRDLIKESNAHGFKWYFDAKHKEAVQKLRNMMTEAPVLRFYSLDEPVVISGDASQAGLGCVLLQGDMPVAYGSKALTSAEKAYAQIEKEMLAIVFSVRKFHSYIYGRQDVIIETDHAPLIRIMEKPLHAIPMRLQKMRMKLQGYTFKLVAKRGTEIPVADALSRAYIPETGPNLTGEESHIFAVSEAELPQSGRVRTSTMTEIRNETKNDAGLQELITVIRQGWPEHRAQVGHIVKPYFDYQEELAIIDDIIYKSNRVVVPKSMRSKALQMLHSGHQGIVRSKQLARDLLYWPGINKQVEDMVSKCGTCQERRAAQAKEPLMPTEIPEGPWQHVAQDLFDCFGKKWLLIVDYYSNWFEFEKLEYTNGEAVIRQTKKWFSVYGIPEQLTSDNGPPWNGQEFTEFSKTYGFKHTTTSPTHPQANGMVEKTVSVVKNMLLKCHKTGSDPYLALLMLRNTPPDGVTGSPAQRLMARRTRTILPTAKERLEPEVRPPAEVSQRLHETRHGAKKHFDKKTIPLPPLTQGDTIRVRVGRDWMPARLLPEQPNLPPRSYAIQLPSGRVTRRNRRDLLKTHEGAIYRQIPANMEVEDEIPDTPAPMYAQPVQPPSPLRYPPPTPTLGPAPPGHIPITLPIPDLARPIPRAPPSPIRETPNPGPLKQPTVTRTGRVSKAPGYLEDYVP